MSAMGVMDGIPHLLWTTSWQAGLMAAIIWLACRQWPRMPANLRVMLWWLVSLKFALGLVWTQPIPLPVLPASMASVSVAPAANGSAGVIGSADAIGSSERRPSTTGSSQSSPTVDAMVNLGLAAAAGLWLLGVFVQGVLLMRQLLRTRQLVARSSAVEGDAAELFDDLVTRLDVRAFRPTLRVSTDIGTPQVTGLTRPVILLPVGALETFSRHELSLTLCHELMHVKRFDLWHGWIPSAAARLFFFHPLARLAAREYAIAREAACDARVLAFMDAPAHDYGRLLMRLGITARDAAPAAAGASPTLRTLKRRLLMLHDASTHARGLSPRWWALAALAAVLVIPMRPTAQQNPANLDNRQNQPNQQNQPNPSADSRNDDGGEPWVFIQDDENTMTHGSALDRAYAMRLRKTSEPLVWFKRAGVGYVIRDARTIANVRALFIPQEQVHKEMHALEDRQTILAAKQSELGRQQEELGEQLQDVHARLAEAQADLQKTIAPPAHPSEEARRAVRDELLQREGRLHEAEARQRDTAARQEALAIQQRVLGEQQGALGHEQGAFGRQIGELSRQMEREMRNLFEAAITAGLAQPVK